MQGLDLEDERLNRRARMVLEALANVGESTPDVMRTKAALDGTYRLMDNSKVTKQKLIEPHFQQSIARTSRYTRALLVQDTTEVDLTKPNRQVEGAGPLEARSRHGFYLHPLIAYTSKGVPLGLVGNLHWARETIDTTSTASQKQKKRKARPIEEKESHRWVKMTQLGKQIAKDHPHTEYVGVSDSESDIYEVFSELVERPDNYHLLVRACQDRAITDCEILSPEAENNKPLNISEALDAAPLSFRVEIKVRGRKAKTKAEDRNRRQTRDARTALAEVRAARITFRPPYRPNLKLPPLTCNIVEVREINPPGSETPVHWTLITTLPIHDQEAIKEIIDAYKKRWCIELFFRTLKSGMGLEKLRYQTLARYINAVMPLMIVAWRVQMLTHAARAEPEASCEEFFDAEQWHPLWLVSHPGQSLPDTPPLIHELLLMVAAMGGHIKRKGQGPPGTNTVWRGLRRLETLTLAYATFGQIRTDERCEV